MTDTYHQPKAAKPDLDPCDHDIFTLSWKIGVGGSICLLVGITGLIATSGQTTWDIARSLYVLLLLGGPLAILIAQLYLRILMKHRRKQLSIFDRL